MKATRSQLIRIIVLLLLPASSLWAQLDVHDWNNVKNIAPGSEIWIKGAHGKHMGTFESADDAEIRVLEWRRSFFGGGHSRLTVLPKVDIREVRFARPVVSALAGAAIGAGIGIGIGLGVEAQYPNKTEDGHLLSGVLGFLGGAFGGAVGRRAAFVHGARIYFAP